MSRTTPAPDRSPGIAGMLVSDGPALQRARCLNRLLIAMARPEERAHFQRAPQEVMDRYGLSHEQRALLAGPDWPGMLAHGASIYAMAKGARAFGQSLLDVGAAMRGCSTKALQAQLPIHALRADEAHHG